MKTQTLFTIKYFKRAKILFFVLSLQSIIGYAQIAQNLQLDLDFSNNIIDSSSQNQSTQLFGNTGFGVDKWGNVNSTLKLSGTANSGELRLTDFSGSYKINFPASFSAWVKIDAFESVYSPVLTTEDHGSAYSGFWIEVTPSGAVSASFGNGGPVSSSNRKTYETASGIIQQSKWHHIGVVFNSATDVIIYVDGFSKAITSSGSATTCVYHMINGTAGKIGGFVKGGSNRTLNGSVDKVQIFNRSLTLSELLALYYVTPYNQSTLLLNFNMNANSNDSSLFVHNTAQYGSCQFVNDREGNASSALQCSTTSAIEVTHADAPFKCNFPMSFATWIKLDGLGTVNPIFTNEDDTTAYTGMWAQILSDGKLAVNIGSGVGTGSSSRRSYITTTSLAPNSLWVHVAIVLKSAPAPAQFTAEIYVNGIIQPLQAQSGTGGALNYKLGNLNWAKIGTYRKGPSTYTLNGALDGTMFWNDSISQQQILNIINNYYNTCSVSPLVIATAISNPICLGSSTTLYGTGATSFTWTGGVVDNASFTPTASEIYTVVGVDGNTCLGLDTISVDVVLPVAINASDTTVCSGASVTLSASGSINYSWTSGVVNATSFIPSATVTYTVTGVEVNSCGNSDTVTITVHELPIVTVNASADSVCSGTMVTLQGVGANSYTWTGGITDNVGFVPVTSTTYTVIGTDLNMCSDTTSATLVVNSLPDTSISVAGNTITAATLSGASYQWLNCNNAYSIIPLQTNQSFTATAAGNYAVIITLNGCSDTSSCVSVSSVGITKEENNSYVTIFPNPATNTITIKSDFLGEHTNFDLYSFSGHLVYTLKEFKNEQMIDISDYAKGVYFAKFRSSKGVIVEKLIIR